MPPHFLSDQLTLSKPGGTDYAHLIKLVPPDSQTFQRPWIDQIIIDEKHNKIEKKKNRKIVGTSDEQLKWIIITHFKIRI